MSPWFRMYQEILDDPKVQRLPPDLFKMWVNVLALTSRYDGELPSVSECAWAFRMPESETEIAFHALENVGLLKRKGARFIPHGWEKRQYVTDTSTTRVRKFRERKKALHETPSDTESDTDTEKKKKSSLRSDQKKVSPETHGARLPERWKPGDEQISWAVEMGLPSLAAWAEADKFRDHWRSQPGQRGRKSDWEATWRNWVRKALEVRGTGPPGDRAEAVRDAVRRAAVEADRRDAQQQPRLFAPEEKPDGKPN